MLKPRLFLVLCFACLAVTIPALGQAVSGSLVGTVTDASGASVPAAKVTITELIALRLRRIPLGLIVDGRITAVKSGLPVSIDELSTHFLAGGNVQMVVLALVAAKKAGINLVFDRACAIDLATKGTQKTVLEAVKTSVNPKVIDCPAPSAGKTTIDAVAKDGIVIRAKARVTVRTNLDRFVGGATEETIIARVGEGIVSTIGSASSYKEVLENPDRISKTVLDKALDSNTAFEILSIDIADVDVGENVGAKLQAERVEIWTDVPGMFSANPRSIPSARLLHELDYDEAQEIASTGAKVLHPRCIAPVRAHGIPLWVASTEQPEHPGTVVGPALERAREARHCPDQPMATPMLPTAYSMIRSQPMIHATSSPSVA